MKDFENYTKDFEMSELRKEEQNHQQKPQEPVMKKAQQEAPQQELQELRKEKPQQEKPAEADLAAGGGAKATLLARAWLPAEPNKAGFAGQGRSAQ